MRNYCLKVYYHNSTRPVRLFYQTKQEANTMRDELRTVREVRKVALT